MEKLEKNNKTEIRSWVIIFVLAVLFVAWGLFIFFTVGDKGPPSWNFGVVRDVPGESAYSTHQAVKGRAVPPESQHVLGKPSQIVGKPGEEKP